MKRKRQNFKLTSSSIIIIVLFLLVISIGFSIYGKFRVKTYNCTVTGKEVKRVKDDDLYLVYTKDISDGTVMVFKIEDSVIPFRRNSSDIYGGIEINKSYTFTVRGFRIRLFSEYQNIYKYTEINIE